MRNLGILIVSYVETTATWWGCKTRTSESRKNAVLSTDVNYPTEGELVAGRAESSQLKGFDQTRP